jgi:hypothetical protein
VRAVQTRDIFIRFITTGGCSVQAMDLNLDRTLGPRVPVTSPEVLRRLLAYLGAMPEALREFDRSHQSHGKGNVRITLELGRKNLLRLHANRTRIQSYRRSFRPLQAPLLSGPLIELLMARAVHRFEETHYVKKATVEKATEKAAPIRS